MAESKKAIKNRAVKTAKKIEKLIEGISPDVVAQYGTIEAIDLNSAKDVPALLKMQERLDQNLAVARRAHDTARRMASA